MNDNNVSEIIDSKIIDNDNGQITAGVMREVLHAIDKAAIERHRATETSINKIAERQEKDIQNSKNDIEANERDIKRLDEKITTLSSQIKDLNDICLLSYEELYRLAYHKELEPGKRYAINNPVGFFKYDYNLGDRNDINGNLTILKYDFFIVLEALTSSSFSSDALRLDKKGNYDAVRFVFDYPTMNQGVMQPWLSIGPTEVEENVAIWEVGFIELPDGYSSRVYWVEGYDYHCHIYYTDETKQTFRFVEEADGGAYVQNDTADYQYNDFLRVFAGWRGAVVWMRDEKGNEAPYDFKTYGVTNLSEGYRAVCAETNIGNFSENSSIRMVNGRNNIYKDMSLFLTYGEGNVIEKSYGAGYFMNSRLTNCIVWGRECVFCDIRNLRITPPLEDPAVLLVAEEAVIEGNTDLPESPLEMLFYIFDGVSGHWYYDYSVLIMRRNGTQKNIYPLPVRGRRISLLRSIAGCVVSLGCLFKPDEGGKENLRFVCRSRNTDEVIARLDFSVSNEDYHPLNLRFVAREDAYTVYVETPDGDACEGDYQNIIFEEETLY